MPGGWPGGGMGTTGIDWCITFNSFAFDGRFECGKHNFNSQNFGFIVYIIFGTQIIRGNPRHQCWENVTTLSLNKFSWKTEHFKPDSKHAKMLKMDVIIVTVTTKTMFAQRGNSWGGSSKSPLEQKFLRGGGCKPKTFRGRGMDIFWNHTILLPQPFKWFLSRTLLKQMDWWTTDWVWNVDWI